MKNNDFVIGKPGAIYVRSGSLITNEIIAWLDAYEGKGVYSRALHGIYFSREEDAVMFKLRWA